MKSVQFSPWNFWFVCWVVTALALGLNVYLNSAYMATIDLMRDELAKSCHAVVPYEPGMTLLPGQSMRIEIPLDELLEQLDAKGDEPPAARF